MIVDIIAACFACLGVLTLVLSMLLARGTQRRKTKLNAYVHYCLYILSALAGLVLSFFALYGIQSRTSLALGATFAFVFYVAFEMWFWNVYAQNHDVEKLDLYYLEGTNLANVFMIISILISSFTSID
ncbi:MAG: hypothetical protein AAFV69_05185 [Pseudomonadota bacterium]